MTPEERQLLTDLANKIAQTPAQQRDQEAEEFIRTKIGSRPDALYLMTQTVLIQNMAIEHAHQQIEQLQQQVSRGGPPAPQNSPGFLGGGPNRQSTWGTPAAPPNYSQQQLVLTIRRRPLTRRYPLHQARKAADRVFCEVRRRPQLALRPERLPLREFARFLEASSIWLVLAAHPEVVFWVVATVRAGPSVRLGKKRLSITTTIRLNSRAVIATKTPVIRTTRIRPTT